MYLSNEFEITARSEDGTIMAIQHNSLRITGIQFHPESILTSPAHGMTILKNALRYLKPIQDNDEGIEDIIEDLDSLSVDDLKERLSSAGLGTSGNKADLVVN